MAFVSPSRSRSRREDDYALIRDSPSSWPLEQEHFGSTVDYSSWPSTPLTILTSNNSRYTHSHNQLTEDEEDDSPLPLHRHTPTTTTSKDYSGRDLSNFPKPSLPGFTFWCPSPNTGEALGFLFNVLIRTPRPGTSATGYMEELPGLFSKPDALPVIRHTATAVSLALYGTYHRRRDIMEHANETYLASIKDMQMIIPTDRVGDDDVLLATSLLGYYEFIRAAYTGSPFCNIHESALSELLKHRGYSQLKHPTSKRLFFTLQSQLALSCAMKRMSLRDLLADFAHVEDDDPQNVGTRLSSVCVHVPDLIVELDAMRPSPGGMDSSAACLKKIEEAIAVDERFEDWALNVPEKWRYKPSQENLDWLGSDIYSNLCHIYPSATIAIVWNTYRVFRICLNLSVFEASQAFASVDAVKYWNRSLKLLHALTEDICASIPYFVGNRQVSKDLLNVRYPQLMGQDLREHMTQVTTASPFQMVVPLTCCQRLECLPDSLRKWLERQRGRMNRLLETSFHSSIRYPETTGIDVLPLFMFSRPINTYSAQAFPAPVQHPYPESRKPSWPPSRPATLSTEDSPHSRHNSSLDGSVDKEDSPTTERKPENKFVCQQAECRGQAFSNTSNLLRHQREKHGRSEAFVCGECGAQFTRQDTRQRHIDKGRCPGRDKS